MLRMKGMYILLLGNYILSSIKVFKLQSSDRKTWNLHIRSRKWPIYVFYQYLDFDHFNNWTRSVSYYQSFNNPYRCVERIFDYY